MIVLQGKEDYMTTDNRRAELSHVRAMVSAVQAECDTLRESWPDRYPVPVGVDAAYRLEELVLSIARCE